MAGFAQTIAKGYRSATYTKAADELRFPFWDWAALPQRFPDVMTWPSVRINTPTGLKNVTNPLYRYEFLNHPEPEEWFPTKDGDAWMAEQPWTVRNADANNQSQFGPINSNLADDGPFLTTQVVSSPILLK
jgi:tyrosinase